MQFMHIGTADGLETLSMPDAREHAMPGIAWGRFDEVGTPAYWRGQSIQFERAGHYASTRLGDTLCEEVAACLLGGYGMTAEVAMAAFRLLRGEGNLHAGSTAVTLERSLSQPLAIGARSVRYRFPRQKARYLAGCLEALAGYEAPPDDVDLRADLMRLPGIGPKTASWIVRNHRRSDRVAILDVHVVRAGVMLAIFSPGQTPARDYLAMEGRFLAFASAIGVAAGPLDGIMWRQMRILSRYLPLVAAEAAALQRPTSATPTALAGTAASSKTASSASAPLTPRGQKEIRKAAA